ncbi:MAG: hypothetical protein HZA29_05300 [Candidatus Omnitrophica bacterium]|nr:hypothetical protein [Candidatus Omnitrophota bacterium]
MSEELTHSAPQGGALRVNPEPVEGLTQQLEQLIMPCILNAGAELVELNLKRRGNTYIVEILADKKAGGITISECSAINKEIFQICDQSGLVGEDFEVDVSSPGLDRPLKTPGDFTRVIGRDIRFHLRVPVNGRLECSGTLREVREGQVIADTPQGLMELPIGQIQKAVQIIEIE